MSGAVISLLCLLAYCSSDEMSQRTIYSPSFLIFLNWIMIIVGTINTMLIPHASQHVNLTTSKLVSTQQDIFTDHDILRCHNSAKLL